MFESPVAYCPICGGYVALDQTQPECARAHGCGEFKCPLERFFVAYCPLREEYVLLDQTQRECAREHGCNALRCPLRGCFTGAASGEAPDVAGLAKALAMRHPPPAAR
ncbi:MAG TPA: hypothetical protein VF814_08975 [Casimicrobiaceae bacterium]